MPEQNESFAGHILDPVADPIIPPSVDSNLDPTVEDDLSYETGKYLILIM